MKRRPIISIFVILLLIFGIYLYQENALKEEKKEEEIIVVEPIVEVIEEKQEEPIIETDPYYLELMDIWDANKAISQDYVGEVSFDSGLIDFPFVCPTKNYREYRFFTNTGRYVSDYDNGCEGGSCSGNDVYLRMNWKTMKYDLGGSVFMDYRNSVSDENIIIYGHHYYKNLDKDRVLFFTPLEKLLSYENYEENKYLQIVLNGEIRRYEVAYVYKYHVSKDYSDYIDLQYYRTNYNHTYSGEKDEGYYEKYIAAMEKAKLYDTGVKLTTSDNTLTLQTCLEETTQALQVVVCKEIERIKVAKEG